MVPHEDRVDHSKDGLLVDTRIASQETVNILAGPNATFIRFVKLQWEKLFEAELVKNGKDLGKEYGLKLILMGQ